MTKPKMISRVVTQSVTVVRDGKRVSPKLNQSFDFTEDEIEYLDAVSPRASRNPTNESPARRLDRSTGIEGDTADEGDEEDAGDDETAPDKKAEPTATRTPKRGAAKAAKAEGDEGEDDDI